MYVFTCAIPHVVDYYFLLLLPPHNSPPLPTPCASSVFGSISDIGTTGGSIIRSFADEHTAPKREEPSLLGGSVLGTVAPGLVQHSPHVGEV